MMMVVNNFSEIEQEFIQRVHTIVWCNVATVDSQGRPRSRILHPIWEGSTGWILTQRDSYKSKHLAANPHVSLAYVADITKPVYVDGTAQ
jgi:pyridoxine/pyridoxamine 5'-phosphate oxidase